jgi:hypothetical protein
MLNEKGKDFITKYKVAIATGLLVILVSMFFVLGAAYSCENGYLKGLKCVDPVAVATVSVCEYNPINCASNCQDFLIDDVGEFCAEFSRNPTSYG